MMVYINAFLFCGTICMLGQILYDNTKWINSWTNVTQCYRTGVQ